MAQNDLQLSNENAHSQSGSEEDSMDVCDNTLETSQEGIPDRSRRKGSDVHQLKQSTLEDARHDSSLRESYMQDIPLDFSMPKRKDGINSLSNSPKQEIHSPFISPSPPHTMVSGRNSSNIYNECGGTNGCVSPVDVPSEHILSGPCDSKSSDTMSTSLVNGQLIDAGMSSDFLLRERSHSFSSSSLQKQRHHAIPQRQPRSGVWRGGGQLRPHHMNETALMSAIAANTVGYSELISPHPPVCTSPILGNVQSVGNEEVLSMYKDHMHKLGGVDKHRYTFLASGIPSCVTESVSGNSIIASLPNMLAPSIPSTAGRHSTATASATAATNCNSSSITPPSTSSISSTSSSCTMVTTTPAKRRPRSLPDNQKDEAYWERRRKNNEAAKRSRDARRMKEEEIALRASFLEQENLKLKVEVASLKTETAKLKCLLFNS